MSKFKYKIRKAGKKFISKHNNKKYSEDLYEQAFNRKINWENPEYFNEKLMYLKVFKYNLNPTVWNCSDKYQERLYAISRGIKEKHLPELVGIYKRARDIKEEDLPNKFTMKCTHGYDFNIACDSKKDFDMQSARKKLNKWQRTKYGYDTGEIHYTHIIPRIMVEKYDAATRSEPDYKIYCFNGKPQVILACTNREKEVKLNFYDLKWNELDLAKDEFHGTKKLKAPRYLHDMIGISKKLAHGFPFVRIDFYETKDCAMLGGLTFTPSACLATYYTEEGSKYLGNLLEVKGIL
jgi:hypothetical protein